ncbi:hypothetical protein KDA10_01990 [candidate division WWE3 bacterium]|uniref:Uncharacterized protein n=1 Tax=candidate division WWE3 bacterium TaxID=2053526 RepID=A0A955IX34_UNCKA|nr:hypothetical protein [candidate division WWE3 bacterium]
MRNINLVDRATAEWNVDYIHSRLVTAIIGDNDMCRSLRKPENMVMRRVAEALFTHRDGHVDSVVDGINYIIETNETPGLALIAYLDKAAEENLPREKIFFHLLGSAAALTLLGKPEHAAFAFRLDPDPEDPHGLKDFPFLPEIKKAFLSALGPEVIANFRDQIEGNQAQFAQGCSEACGAFLGQPVGELSPDLINTID